MTRFYPVLEQRIFRLPTKRLFYIVLGMNRLFGLDFISEPEPLRVVEEVFRRLRLGQRGIVVTANPEIMLHAWRDRGFYGIIQKAIMRTIDGTGLALVGSCITKKRLFRAHGSDLLPLMLRRAEVDSAPVHFIINPHGLLRSEALQQELMRRWPRLKFSLSLSEADIPQKVRLIFANHGAPAQEYLLNAIVAKHPAPCIGIGIGAALDFLIGTQIRAPKWMRRIGLEWLYRLVRQPWRIRRIINATIIFPIIALRHLDDRPSTTLRQ